MLRKRVASTSYELDEMTLSFIAIGVAKGALSSIFVLWQEHSITKWLHFHSKKVVQWFEIPWLQTHGLAWLDVGETHRYNL